ncbi:hypothetical protein DFH09DRAFT_1182518, partial [Mycena vulgaris]
MLPLRLARQPLLLVPVLQPHNLRVACQTSALNPVTSQFLLFNIATLISCIVRLFALGLTVARRSLRLDPPLIHRNAFVSVSPVLYYMSGWRQDG